MTEEQIFHEWLERPADQRAAFLSDACGDDTALFQRVGVLLAAHANPGSFLASPPAADEPFATVDQSLAEKPGTQIGPYKLLQQIGEGGMGVVYMVEQKEPVERRVALKIIKPGMDTRQVIARFEAERQALAMMDHPNIAKVLDAGTTESGRPYFVMELVRGVPITQYCDEHHLTPRQRLELLLPVCQAIQHAHQKGVIHRDIKPTNILVAEYDNEPVPKVIDFGVAKAIASPLTEKTMFTGFGQLVGTLEYMSPEQAKVNQLEIDTRSDIYSLGIVLYELLTGSTPFDNHRLRSASFDEMLRIIREEEPEKPSTRLSSHRTPRDVPGPTRCMDAPESPTLASIAAVRGTEPARLSKLVRGELDWIVMKALEKDRNRRYETASGLAADLQRHLADEPVQACPPSAAYRFRKFFRRNTASIALASFVGFFILLFAGVVGWGMHDRAAREHEIAKEEARRLALAEQGVREALDRAVASRVELHRLLNNPGSSQELLNQPTRWELFLRTAEGEVAQAHRMAARTEGQVDIEMTAAVDQLERQVASDQADYDLALRLEKIRLNTATWVDGGFDYRTAADDYAQALAGFEVLKDDPAAVAARLSVSPIKDLLVAALDHWALAAHMLREHGSAEQLLLLARQAAPDPALGDWVRQPEVLFGRDPETLGKLVSELPAARLSTQLLDLVGVSLRNVDSPLAETWLRQAQAEHPADFWLSFDLGLVLLKTNPEEAAGFFRLALAVRPETSAAYGNLGVALQKQLRLPEAIAAYHKAIRIHAKDAKVYNNLGSTLRDLQKLPEAIAAYHKAIEFDPQFALAYRNLGLALFEQNKRAEAFAACERAIKLNAMSAWAWSGRGWLHMCSGALEKAIADQSKAVALEPTERHHWNDRSVTYLKLGQLEKSLADSAQAIELDPKFADAWFNYGEAHRRLGQHVQAIIDYRTAIDLKTLRVVDALLAHRQLGRVLEQIGEQEEARKAYACAIVLDRKAVELAPNSPMLWQELGWDQYCAGDWVASIESLEKSCKLQQGGTGDCGQWIVLALAHARLAAQDTPTVATQEQHRAQAQRWYEQAVKQIDAWDAGGDPIRLAIRDYRVQADEMIGSKAKKD